MSTTVLPIGTKVAVNNVEAGPGSDLTDTNGLTGIVVDYPDMWERLNGAPEDGHYIELETGEIVGLESRHLTEVVEAAA